MLLPTGTVAVRFHGGFLDGQTARSGDPPSGGVIDYWSAERLHAITAGQVGACMTGVSPEGFSALRNPGETAPTVVLQHRYRVTASRIDDGALVIDVAYEFVPD